MQWATWGLCDYIFRCIDQLSSSKPSFIVINAGNVDAFGKGMGLECAMLHSSRGVLSGSDEWGVISLSISFRQQTPAGEGENTEINGHLQSFPCQAL